MSPVTLAELDPKTRAKMLKQIGETEGTTALATVEPTISFGEPAGVRFTRSGLTFSQVISLEDWTALGQKLKTIEGSLQFWIGDWLNYGEKTYGMKYFDAIATTGYDDGYLRNLSSVARNVDLSHRCDNLSWTHHREVAALEPKQQTKFLDWAEKEKVSVKELRTEVKQQNQPGPAPNPTEIYSLREWIRVECPGLDAVVQAHVLYGAESKTFDLETRDLTTDEVKLICTLLRDSRSEGKAAA